jgi:hypothetical protein
MNMQGGQPQQGHGMQPSAETDQIAANFNSEKGCINCLLMTGLICGGYRNSFWDLHSSGIGNTIRMVRCHRFRPCCGL